MFVVCPVLSFHRGWGRYRYRGRSHPSDTRSIPREPAAVTAGSLSVPLGHVQPDRLGSAELDPDTDPDPDFSLPNKGLGCCGATKGMGFPGQEYKPVNEAELGLYPTRESRATNINGRAPN
jgi:hypothetical protein